MLVTFEAKQTQSRSLNGNSIKNSKVDENDHVIQNIDNSNPPNLKAFSISRKKHKGGCITCKIRKKRCSEERPICSDCDRLGKNCVWATEEMSVEKIRELKRQVEESEKGSKRRRVDKRPSIEQKKNNVTKKIKEAHPSNFIKHESPQFHQNHDSPMSLSNFIEGDIPLDGEMIGKSPKPIPGSVMALSPRWDIQSQDNLFEFNNFFESNLRSNINKYSDKITELDKNTDLPLPKPINTPSPTPSSTALHHINALENMFNNGDFPAYDFSIPRQPFPIHFDLDNVGSRLYDYYQHVLARIVCIAPADSNYYLKIFLPMAQQNQGILYSILAWSGYHLGGEYLDEGTKYMTKALDYMRDTPAKSDTETSQRLASLLILCAAEICKGDVRKWPIYLDWAAKIIKQRGGLEKLKGDKEQHWLMSSFAYHDILASSTSERGTYFSVEQYCDLVVKLGFGINPLLGVVKPLFNMIAEISALAIEIKRLLSTTTLSASTDNYNAMNTEYLYEGEEQFLDVPGVDSPDFEPSSNGTKVSKHAVLSEIMDKAKNLESKISEARPDSSDLESVNEDELELHLTLFELFQLAAKLHLRQSILQVSPSSLESQYLLCALLKNCDIVLGSSLEGSLCFPLFVAGMHCITRKDRRQMLMRFHGIRERYKFKNLDRAKAVMEQVWLVDPMGSRCVDWYDIVKKLGWDLNFA